MRSNQFEPLVESWLLNADAAIAQIQTDPWSFGEELERAAASRMNALAPLFHYGGLAVAVMDASGTIIRSTKSFHDTGIASFQDFIARAEEITPGSPLRRLQTASATSPIFCVAAAGSNTGHWQLPPGLEAEIASTPGGTVVICVGAVLPASPIGWACDAHGMTDFEKRLVTATIRTGQVKLAAKALNIQYSTARKAINDVCRTLRVANLPALVSRITATSFGAMPSNAEASHWLADVLPLTERQASIALLIAEGLSRPEISEAVDCSLSLVRKELEAIYASLSVSSATELSRLVTECRAMSLLTAATDSSPGCFDPALEPTMLTARSNGHGKFAWSDYGPRSGMPVLVVHSMWSCRSVPRRFVAALQAKGFRPIAIDRPGYGLSDNGLQIHDRPFDQAIGDVIELLDRQKIQALPLVSRGGAQFVYALQQAMGERLNRAVLVSPSPFTTEHSRAFGPLGVAKLAFAKGPKFMELLVRLVSSQLTMSRMQRLLLAGTRPGSKDREIIDDAAWLRDHYRAIRPFTTGNWTGLLREQPSISMKDIDYAEGDYSHWTIVTGAQDSLDDHDSVINYWRVKAPGAKIEIVSDGGRFMTSTHPQFITKLLRI